MLSMWLMHLGAVVVYGLAAGAVGWFTPGATVIRALAGMTAFLAAALVHEIAARRLAQNAAAREVLRLRKAQAQTAGQAQRAQGELNRNFRFVKIGAGDILSEEAQSRMIIHVADFGEKLKRSGIALIADKVEEEAQVLRLMELNVTVAQGYLFGEPAPLRERA